MNIILAIWLSDQSFAQIELSFILLTEPSLVFITEARAELLIITYQKLSAWKYFRLQKS